MAVQTVGEVHKFCLVKDGVIVPTNERPEDWLKRAPRGAYTAARTVGKDAVFELTAHVQRLAKTASLMIEADEKAGQHVALTTHQRAQLCTDEAWLRVRVVGAMRSAILAYRSLPGAEPDAELRLTMLLHWGGGNGGEVEEERKEAARAMGQQQLQQEKEEAATAMGQQQQQEEAAGQRPPQPAAAVSSSGDSGFSGDRGWLSVNCLAEPLPPRPKPPIKAEVRGAPRSNAAAKDSGWVAARAALLATKDPESNEVLLAGPGGEVMEGLSSNFYAVLPGGRVATAGQGVLLGTVREAVLEVCGQEGVGVVLSPPLLADLGRWEGAFISSTSRLVLPVDEVVVYGHPTAAVDSGGCRHRQQQQQQQQREEGDAEPRPEEGRDERAGAGASGEGTGRQSDEPVGEGEGEGDELQRQVVVARRRFERNDLAQRLAEVVQSQVASRSERVV